MQLANQEAQRFNHEYIGTEHILLGLIREGSGVAANVLKHLEVDLHKIRFDLEMLIHSEPDKVSMGKLPQTPCAKRVIEYAMEEARTLDHDYVGTEHMLLGLLRENEAALVLLNLGVPLDKVRAEIQATLQGWSEPEGRNEYSGLSRIHWPKSRSKTVETPPAACPKCGAPHLVRVLWKRAYLISQQDQDDINAGKAILGSCTDMAGSHWV